MCGGLALLRLAEDIKGKPSSPPVPDAAFPSSPNDDKLDGLFRLFDFLLDNDVKTGSVSINDVRQGRRDKIVQLIRSLKGWEDKRLDGHFKNQRDVADKPDADSTVFWFTKMKAIMGEIDNFTQCIPDRGRLEFLDIG